MVLAAQALKKGYSKPLKVKSPNLYYGKSHMECYNFC